MPTRLKPYEADRMRDLPLTYAEVGATAGTLPPDYRHLEEDRVVGHGRAAFETAAEALMGWVVQRRAGLGVQTSSDRVELDAVAVIRLGPRPFAVRAPVRVVAVIVEPERRGFSYGTLPGHPETGEESFVLTFEPNERDESSAVRLTIRAFSRPGGWLGRLSGPAGRGIQRQITRRYLRALG
jgi:uncharacterized protein (UPF0548 family)